MKKIAFIFLATFALLFSNYPTLRAQTGRNEALETLGSLSGLLLYNTYVTIGSIGDGFEKDVYDADYISDVMDEQIGGINTVNDQLLTLVNSGFLTDHSDLDFVKGARSAFSLLIKQAKALKAYSASKSVADSDQFQEYRNEAWLKISTLLGIGDNQK